MKTVPQVLLLWAATTYGVREALAFLPTSSQQGLSQPSARQMFTGIVEEMGTVVSLEEREDMPLWDGSQGKGTELVVKGDVVMQDAYLG